jgi:predicted cupin superfamily sugar epimerase
MYIFYQSLNFQAYTTTSPMTNKEVEYLKDRLDLSELPEEGGYYKETYRSDKTIILPSETDGERSISTSIYYLLDGTQFSAFHRLISDEIWHFYRGSSITLYIISKMGILSEVKLGSNIENGEHFQIQVRAGSWFAATVNDKSSYALLGCTVSPGFDHLDFELGDRKKLIEMYPQHRSTIERLTRSTSN